MTTHDQFIYYKNFAYSIFDYLLSKINRYIKCELEVDYSDMVNFTFANIRKPNIISLHINNIVYECGNGYNKNKVCSMIFIALTHELFHVEQLISQELYRSDFIYKQNIESAVELQTIQFLKNNSKEILVKFGVNIDLSYYDSINLSIANYERMNTIENIYKYTIMNVIFRRDYEYKEFESRVLDRYRNISIAFENGPNFLIKSNGEFYESTLNEFINAVGYYIGKYDRYTVNIKVMDFPHREKDDIAQVMFTLSDRKIYPMAFRNDS